MEKWQQVSGLITRLGFRIAFVLFLGIVFTAFYTVVEFKDFSQWTYHTHEVLLEINTIGTLLERAENSQRAYLLAHNPLTLKSYSKALDQLTPSLEHLRTLVADNPLQSDRVAALNELIRTRIEKLDDVLKRSESLSADESGKFIDTDAMAVLRSKIEELEAEEQSLLQIRQAKSERMSKLSVRLIILGALFSLSALVINRRSLQKSYLLYFNQSLLLNSIFDSMSSGLVVVDAQGKVTKSNKLAETLIGISPVGTSSADRIKAGGFINIETGEPMKTEESALARSLKGTEVTNFEALSKRPGMEPRYLSIDSRPIRSPDGEILGAMSLFQDVTQRKGLELEWKRARKAALEASRLKSDFLATMSHEIRTPMNGVIGMTTLLMDTKLDSEQASYVKTIKSSADSLLSLINQVLDHARIESGKLELNAADFNMPELLDEVLSMFRYLARSKNVELELVLNPNLPNYLHGDAARVRQILVNLIGNALKFTEKGFVRLTVSPDSFSNDVHKVLFEIKDTGMGIPKSSQSKLFGKFSQVHSADHLKFGGSGLGLMISQKLSELMGGEIGVDSVEGFGSRFWFTADFGVAKKAVYSTLSAAHPRKIFTGHVLVAEDQLVNQAVIGKFLKIFGLTSEIVNNGEEAVEAYKRGSFQLVLMDCQMPLMNGYEATTKIRQHEKVTGQKTPIVALTAEGRSGDRTRCFEVGMDDFLVKPLNIDLLSKVLEDKINKPVADPSFDVQALEKLANFDSDGIPLALVLIQDFLNSTPKVLERLRAANIANDLAAIGAEAHALRSSSLTLGLVKLGKLCEELEADPALKYVSFIESAWSAGSQWLNEYARSKSSKVA